MGLYLVPIVCVTSWWLYSILNPSIGRDAKTHLVSLLDNDPDALYRFAGEEERRLGLTPEVFRKFWREFAWPRLERCRPLGGVVSEAGPNRTWAIAEVDVRTPSGQTFPLGVTMHGTQEGGKLNLMGSILTSLWLLEAADSQAPMATSRERLTWRRTRLERDRSALEVVGIRGWWTYEWGWLPWDKVLERYRGMEESLKLEEGVP